MFQWSDDELEQLQDEIAPLVGYIRYPLMEEGFYNDNVVESGLLSDEMLEVWVIIIAQLCFNIKLCQFISVLRVQCDWFLSPF